MSSRRRPEENDSLYDPGFFLDFLIQHVGLNNDAQFSRAVGVHPSTISHIRHGRLLIGPTLLFRIHEASGINIPELRKLTARQIPDVHPIKIDGESTGVGICEPEADCETGTLPESNFDYPDYDPAYFLDSVITHMDLRSDAELARTIGVPASCICNIRRGRQEITPALMVRISEASSLEIWRLRTFMMGRQFTPILPDKHERKRTPKATQPETLCMPQIELKADDHIVHIWAYERPLKIFVQARDGTAKITVGIANSGNRSTLRFPTKMEMLACRRRQTCRLLVLAYSALSLFDDLGNDGASMLPYHSVMQRLNQIRKSSTLAEALRRLKMECNP